MKLGNKKYILIVTVLFVIAYLLIGLDYKKISTKLFTNLSFSNINANNTSNGVGNFILTWVEGNTGSTGVLDGDNQYVLNVAPGENNIYNPESASTAGVQVTYQLVFNMGGSIEAPPGTINIRIPRYMFYGRDGNPISNQIIDIPLVAYPEAAGTGYNYQFVTDEGVDYILLSNYETIPPSYAFECSVTWILPTPSDVANGFVREIEGEVGVDFDLNDELDLYSKSNKLTLNYSTDVKINSFNFGKTTHFEADLNKNTNIFRQWRSSWPSSLKPQNASDYIYVLYNFNSSVRYATEPYTFQFIPEIDPDHPEYGGEIVGYCYYESCSSYYNNPNSWNVAVPSNTTSYYPMSSSSSKSSFIVKYPKSIVDDGEERTFTAKLTAKVNGVDGDTDEKSGTVSDTYQFINEVEPTTVEVNVPFSVPSISLSGSKSGGAKSNSSSNFFSSYPYYSRPGLINKFLGNDVNSISTRVNNYQESNKYHSFYLSASGTGYAYTYDTTKDNPNNPDNYGVENWTLVNEDDILFLGSSPSDYERLNYGDYEFTSFIIYDLDVSDYVYQTSTSYNESTKVTTITHRYSSSRIAFSQYGPIDVYVKTDGDYYLYGHVKNWTGYTAAKFEDLDGNVITMNSSNYIPLPPKTTGLKVVHKNNHYSSDLDVYLNVNLINSNHVNSIMSDKNEIFLYNYNTVYMLDNNDQVLDRNNLSTTSAYFGNNQKNDIIALDTQKFGKSVYHGGVSNYYTKYTGGSTNVNKWVNYTNDPANRQVKANYTAYAFDYVNYDPELFTAEEIIRSKVITEQRIGTFYDLLPIGVSVDTDSIKVQKMKIKNSNSSGNKTPSTTSENISANGDEVNIKYSLIENYKGTGRTLLIVKANVEDEDNNISNYIYYSSSTNKPNYAYSGFKLTFTGLYSWDSIADYGSTLRNSVAYKSNSGKLSDAYKDDASTFSSFTDKAYFVDLDEDGNPESSLTDTVYAQRSLAFSYNTASDSSFSIGIKTSDMGTFVNGDDENKKITVNAGGYYTYRLRYASQKNSSTDNLIFYNVLEQGESKTDNGNWHGILTNIDVSHAEEKGIKPVIYYSTKGSFNMYDNGKSSIDVPLPSDTNLLDTTVWTTVKPSNPEDITAVAIDLSKKADGTPYTIASEESVVVLVTMQAPVEGSSEYVANRSEAVNAAWWSGTTTQVNEPSHTHFSVFENTVALLREPQISVGKEAYNTDLNGTDPAVYNGDMLIYDIAVSNISTYEVVSDVGVFDDLPTEVNLIPDKIGYYIEGDGSIEDYTLAESSSLLSYTLNGKKLDFTIARIDAGDVFHIVVPTTVSNPELKENIKNVAQLKSFNNLEFAVYSNEVNNELSYGNLKITKKVVGFTDNKEQEFKFKLELIEPSDGNGSSDNHNHVLNTSYSGISFVDGVGFINVKGNDSLTIEGLPSGYSYKLTEVEEPYFNSKIINSEGTITKNGLTEVTATNTSLLAVPDTLKNTDYMKIVLITCFIIFLIGSCYYEVLIRDKD